MSWYEKGFGGLDKIPEVKRQNRFWLKPGEEKKVIFLDGEPFTFWEHQVTMNGDFRNYFTCLKNVDKRCPLCEAKIKRYFVGILTIIEIAEWEKDGKLYKNPVKLIAIKQKSLKLLKRHADKNRIKNGLFTIGRTDAKAATSGDFFEFEKEVNPLDYNKEAKIFNYDEEFKPWEHDKLENVARLAEPDNSFGGKAVESGEAEPHDEDEVPF